MKYTKIALTNKGNVALSLSNKFENSFLFEADVLECKDAASFCDTANIYGGNRRWSILKDLSSMTILEGTDSLGNIFYLVGYKEEQASMKDFPTTALFEELRRRGYKVTCGADVFDIILADDAKMHEKNAENESKNDNSIAKENAGHAKQSANDVSENAGRNVGDDQPCEGGEMTPSEPSWEIPEVEEFFVELYYLKRYELMVEDISGKYYGLGSLDDLAAVELCRSVQELTEVIKKLKENTKAGIPADYLEEMEDADTDCFTDRYHHRKFFNEIGNSELVERILGRFVELYADCEIANNYSLKDHGFNLRLYDFNDYDLYFETEKDLEDFIKEYSPNPFSAFELAKDCGWVEMYSA